MEPASKIIGPRGSSAGTFRTTHWTVVLSASRPGDTGATRALGQLYSDYWTPLYYYVRRRGHPPHDAEDITQGFFARLIEKHALGGLQREGGRFRSFLLRSMENYLANEWDRARAQKRGGGCAFISKDAEEAEASLALAAADTVTPEVLFERQWVFAMLGHVLEGLRAECSATGKAALFDDLRPHLQGDRSGAAYAEIAARRGMSEGAVKTAAHRLRHRYGELLRAEIARTVSRPEEVDEELRHLRSVAAG